MKSLLLDVLIALWMVNAQCMDSPRNDLSPRCSEPMPIYDVQGVRIQHLAADFHQCTVPYGSDIVEAILREAARAAGATALAYSYHKFEPDGVSATLILGESHISVHYWYEKHYALIDIVTCGSCEPYVAMDLLATKFKAGAVTVHEITRPFK